MKKQAKKLRAKGDEHRAKGKKAEPAHSAKPVGQPNDYIKQSIDRMGVSRHGITATQAKNDSELASAKEKATHGFVQNTAMPEAVKALGDSSKSIKDRLEPLAQLDRRTMDSIRELPEMKYENEFFGRLQSIAGEIAKGDKSKGSMEYAENKLNNLEKQFKEGIEGMRALDAKKVVGEDGGKPVDLAHTADFYDKYGKQAIDLVRQHVGLPSSGIAAKSPANPQPSITPDALMQEFNQLHAKSPNGMVPIHQFRQHVADKFGPEAATHEKLDPIIKSMRGKQLRMVSGNPMFHRPEMGSPQQTPEQIEQGIPGAEEHFLNLKPHVSGEQQAANAPTPTPAPLAAIQPPAPVAKAAEPLPQPAKKPFWKRALGFSADAEPMTMDDLRRRIRENAK